MKKIFYLAAIAIIGMAFFVGPEEGQTVFAQGFSNRDADPIAVADSALYEEDPEAAHNLIDDEYLIVYEREDEILGQRMSASGELLQLPFAISDSDGNKNPSVAFNPVTQSYIVVWQEEVTGDENIWAISVAGTHQTPGDQFYSAAYRVTDSSTDQENPSIACNTQDSSCLVVYEYHDPAFSSVIHADRVDISASAITHGGDTIVVADTEFDPESEPDVVWGDGEQNYLVTWLYDDFGISRIRYARIYDTEQAEFSDADEFETLPTDLYPGLSNNQRHQDAAYAPNDGEYLVVFEYSSVDTGADIYGVRLGGNSGTIILSNLIPIAVTPNSEREPAITHVGGVNPNHNAGSHQSILMVAYKQIDSGSLWNDLWLQPVEEGSDQMAGDRSLIQSYPGTNTTLWDIFLVGSWFNTPVFTIWERYWSDVTIDSNIYAKGGWSTTNYLPLILN